MGEGRRKGELCLERQEAVTETDGMCMDRLLICQDKNCLGFFWLGGAGKAGIYKQSEVTPS